MFAARSACRVGRPRRPRLAAPSRRPRSTRPVATVDEGSFTVTRDGARVGREEFRVVRQPDARGMPRGAATAVTAIDA
jgi:hypothetical protein